MNYQSSCLRPECDKPAYSRGLCASCYNTCAHLVRMKETTWAKLEKSGRVLERAWPGRKRTTANHFLGVQG
jgi:hypothetical protein